MSATRKRWRMGLLAILALAAGGCGEDADILARISRKTLDRLEATGQETAGQLAPRLGMVRVTDEEPALDAKVARRLAWDQALAGLPIEVRLVEEGTVELTGPVADLSQRRRAVELAECTVGVEKVVDSLTSP